MKAAPTKKPKRPAVAGRREDYGAPVEGFFAKQPAPLRAILDELRGLVQQAAPDATASLKWGMPFFTRGGETMCALAAFKSHVNLILPGPPGTYRDPDDRLEGDGKTGKHLKLRSLEDLPRATVRAWLKTAAARVKGCDVPPRQPPELGDMPAGFRSVVRAFAGDASVTVGSGWGQGGVVLKRRGKIFAMLVRGDFVAKLSRERVDELVGDETGTRFDPRHDGRVMNEWVAVPAAAARQWPSLAREALAFADAAGVLRKRRVR